jgi:hypothetical protein
VGVGKRIEGKGLRGIVPTGSGSPPHRGHGASMGQGDGGEVRGRNNQSRIYCCKHGVRIARHIQVVKCFAVNSRK